MKDHCEDCERVLDEYDRCRCGRRLLIRAKLLCWYCYQEYITYNGGSCACTKTTQKTLVEVLSLNKKMLKFGDKTVKTMEFYTNATPLNIEEVNIENLVLSDPIPANKDKDERFVIGYQNQDGNIATLLLKNPEKVYSKGVSCYSEGSALTMSFDLCEYPEWVENYEKILIKVASLGIS